MKKRLPSISKSDYIDDALDMIQERDVSVITAMASESEPEEGVVEGMIFNNTEKEELSCFENDNWKTLVTYKNGVYAKNIVHSKLQPLSSVLSLISKVSPPKEKMALLSLTDSYIVSYFSIQNLLNNVSKETLSLCIGTGELCYKNNVTGVDIDTSSIPPEKFTNSISVTPPILVGDMIYSSSDKEGYIKVKEGYTVGISGATYSGEKYKNIYKVLWENSSFELTNTSGSIVQRGSSYEEDWLSNNLIKLKGHNEFSDIIKLKSSSFGSAFLTSDNILYLTGQYGLSTFTPVLDDVVDFEISNNGVIAIRKDKTVWGRKRNTSSADESMGGAPSNEFGKIGEIQATKLISPKIYTDTSNTFIVNGGKIVLFCGRNLNGELGNGTTESVATLIPPPNQAPFNDVAKMKTSGPTMILTHNGDLYMCGPNQYGQQGDGTRGTSNVLNFVKRASDVKDIAGSYYVSAYLGKDGRAYATGWNKYRAILSVDDNIDYVTSFSRIYKTTTFSDYIKIYIVSDYASIMIRNEATGSAAPLTMSGRNNSGMFGSGDFSANKIVGYGYNIVNNTHETLGFIPDEICSTENYDCLYFYNNTKKELWASGTNNSSSWGKGVASSTVPVHICSNVKLYAPHAHWTLIYTTNGRLLVAGNNNYNRLGVSYKSEEIFETLTDIEELTELTQYIKY